MMMKECNVRNIHTQQFQFIDSDKTQLRCLRSAHKLLMLPRCVVGQERQISLKVDSAVVSTATGIRHGNLLVSSSGHIVLYKYQGKKLWHCQVFVKP